LIGGDGCDSKIYGKYSYSVPGSLAMVKLADEDIRTREVLGWQGIHVLHNPMSSCSQKLRIFLNLKCLDWQSHVVDLAANGNMSDWFLGINPRGLVPVLVQDGSVHIESNDILWHLEQQFPAPCLIPVGSAAEIRKLLHHEDDLHLDLRALSFRYVFNPPKPRKTPEILEHFAKSGTGLLNGIEDRGKAEQLEFWTNYAKQGVTDSKVRTAVARFREAFSDLEQRLSRHAYLLGSQLTVLDIAWYIYVNRLTLAGYPVSRLHRRLGAWFAALQTRPEFAREVAIPAAFQDFIERTRRQHSIERTTLVEVADLH